MRHVYEVYHYRYLDNVKVTSIIREDEKVSEEESMKNFNGRGIDSTYLGEVPYTAEEWEVRERFGIDDDKKFL